MGIWQKIVDFFMDNDETIEIEATVKEPKDDLKIIEDKCESPSVPNCCSDDKEKGDCCGGHG